MIILSYQRLIDAIITSKRPFFTDAYVSVEKEAFETFSSYPSVLSSFHRIFHAFVVGQLLPEVTARVEDMLRSSIHQVRYRSPYTEPMYAQFVHVLVRACLTCECVCVCVCMCVYMCVCLFMHVYMYVCVCIYMLGVYMCICVHVLNALPMRSVCMFVCNKQPCTSL